MSQTAQSKPDLLKEGHKYWCHLTPSKETLVEVLEVTPSYVVTMGVLEDTPKYQVNIDLFLEQAVPVVVEVKAYE